MRHLTGIFSLVPHIIIVIAVFMLNSKKSTSESMLMLTGSIISTLVSVYYVFVMPILLELGNLDALHEYMSLVGLINIVGFFIFSMGFLMFIRKNLNVI
jgi:hypothetical protein